MWPADRCLEGITGVLKASQALLHAILLTMEHMHMHMHTQMHMQHGCSYIVRAIEAHSFMPKQCCNRSTAN